MSEQPRSEQGVSERAIRLVNTANGQTITQLTRDDFRRLAGIVAPDDLTHERLPRTSLIPSR
jgi:YD repeat-containing protein